MQARSRLAAARPGQAGRVPYFGGDGREPVYNHDLLSRFIAPPTF